MIEELSLSFLGWGSLVGILSVFVYARNQALARAMLFAAALLVFAGVTLGVLAPVIRQLAI